MFMQQPAARSMSDLFAAGVGELLRPLFTRWASDEVRNLYESAMVAIWSGRTDVRANLLSRIKALPESHFDDSHHRDFYIMLGLGVLYFAVHSVLAVGDATGDEKMCDDGVVDHLANLLEASRCVDNLREQALKLAPRDPDEGREEMRALVASATPVVSAGLDAVARENGWPANRVR
jgi:hypothetical protein